LNAGRMLGKAQGLSSGAQKPAPTPETPPLIRQHVQRSTPLGLDIWVDIMMSTLGATATFHRGRPALHITDELSRLLDDFGDQCRDAVYAVRNGMIEAVWLDPFHNYVAIVFTKASGDDEDCVLIGSIGDGPATSDA
jgi:hypothetical protein